MTSISEVTPLLHRLDDSVLSKKIYTH